MRVIISTFDEFPSTKGERRVCDVLTWSCLTFISSHLSRHTHLKCTHTHTHIPTDERGIFIVLFECHRQHTLTRMHWSFFFFFFLFFKNWKIWFLFDVRRPMKPAMEFPQSTYPTHICIHDAMVHHHLHLHRRIREMKEFQLKNIFIRRCLNAAVDDDVVVVEERGCCVEVSIEWSWNGDRLLNIINECQCIIFWSEKRLTKK